MKDYQMTALLRVRVEQMCQRTMKTPRDYDWLSEQLANTGERLSATTLKRFWGYLPAEVVKPRAYTLDALSHLLGYKDFAHFRTSHDESNKTPSDPVLGQSLHPARELSVDQRMTLTWQPGRVCTVRHLGNGQFVVEQSELTRLQPGNTFSCELIIEGESLYLDHLVQEGRTPTGYVCGKCGGVHFILL